MNKLLTCVLNECMANRRMLDHKSNSSALSQSELKLARAKLLDDWRFVEYKMGKKTYPSADVTTIEQSKSEILNEIKKDIGNQFNKGHDWDTVFKQPDIKRWLELFERSTKNNFEAPTDPAVLVSDVLGPDNPIEYGTSRDLEMLNDFLTNYMNIAEATHLCSYVASFFY